MNQELVLILSLLRNNKVHCTNYNIGCYKVTCGHCILCPTYTGKYYIDHVIKMGERILCNNI